MWIKNGNRCINADKVFDVCIMGNNFIVASTGERTVFIVQYSTPEYAEKAFNKLMHGIKDKKVLFIMPTEEELDKGVPKKDIDVKGMCMSMEEAINLWNTLGDQGYKQISRVPTGGSQRWQLMKARLTEYSKEQWEKCIDNIHRSELLKKNQDGWFNFDWFIRPSNFPKVLDGNYNSASDRVSEEERGWWDE